MPSNDEVVFGIPQIQCPSCGQILAMEFRRRFDKFSKAQRKEMYRATNTAASGSNEASWMRREPDAEDAPSTQPEKNYIVTSCDNGMCDQYNKFKVLLIPRIKTASAKVDLSD
jgi:hypothetical protein